MQKRLFGLILAVAIFFCFKYFNERNARMKLEKENTTIETKTSEASQDDADKTAEYTEAQQDTPADNAEEETQDETVVTRGDRDVAGVANPGDLALTRIVRGDFGEGQLLQHTGYVSYFSPETNCPVWVAWELTDSEVDGNAKRSNYNFTPDEKVSYSHQVTTKDYSRSGYDRGHMCPAGDMAWSGEAMHDCFYMTNICPQLPEVNQKYWEKLERTCRRWAKQEGSVYIICGPIFTSKQHKTIGREHKIAVPDAFFKVILSLKKGKEKGIGFYYTNEERQQNLKEASRTIDEIERLTGFDFFSDLNDGIENDVEAQCNLGKWH